MDMPREATLQRAGMDWVRSCGAQIYRRNTGGMYDSRGNFVRFSERGASDSWGILPDGRHFELEFKRCGKRPTYDQAVWLNKTNAHGGSVSFWVDDMSVLRRVFGAILEGFAVVYSLEVVRYRIRDKGCTRTVIGPSSDYDLERLQSRSA